MSYKTLACNPALSSLIVHYFTTGALIGSLKIKSIHFFQIQRESYATFSGPTGPVAKVQTSGSFPPQQKKNRLRCMQDATKQKKIRRDHPTCRLKRPSMMLCWHHLQAPTQVRRGSDSDPARDISLQPPCSQLGVAERADLAQAPNAATSSGATNVESCYSSWHTRKSDIVQTNLVISFFRAHQTHADDPFPVQASSTESSSGLPCPPDLAVVLGRKR